jgi:hypothetical protein
MITYINYFGKELFSNLNYLVNANKILNSFLQQKNKKLKLILRSQKNFCIKFR